MAQITLTIADRVEQGYIYESSGTYTTGDMRSLDSFSNNGYVGYVVFDVSEIPAGSVIQTMRISRELTGSDPNWLESASEAFEWRGYGSGSPFQSQNPRTQGANYTQIRSGTDYGGDFQVFAGETNKNLYTRLNSAAASELQISRSQSTEFTFVLNCVFGNPEEAYLEFWGNNVIIDYTPPSQVHLDVPIQASADDRMSDGGWPVSGPGALFDADITQQNFGQSLTGFWRWPINVPSGSTIVSATVVFYPDSDQSLNNNQNWLMAYRDVDNASDYSASTGWYDDSEWVGSLEWDNPGSWTAGDDLGEHDFNSETPDISSYLQAFINRPGYVQGNYFGFLIRYLGGGSNQLAETASYDYIPGGGSIGDGGARLLIDYIPPIEPTEPYTSPNTISVNLYQQIANLYSIHLLAMRDVQEFYLSAAEEILFSDDFDVELNLLRKLYNAFENSDFYNNPAAASISAVASLNAHVIKNARDNDGNRFIDINEWLLAANGRLDDHDDAITVPTAFAEMSSQAGYPIDGENIT